MNKQDTGKSNQGTWTKELKKVLEKHGIKEGTPKTGNFIHISPKLKQKE